LVQGHSSQADQLLQDLKDAAGALGGATIHDASAVLIKAVQAQSDPGEIEFLWVDLEKAVNELVSEATEAREKTPAARPLPAQPTVTPPLLRKAIGLMLPLLTDQDPGAKDCLKDNRTTFRSAFSPEVFVEFEQQIKSKDYTTALEQLRKAAKKYKIPI
jgi:hypothetical protein